MKIFIWIAVVVVIIGAILVWPERDAGTPRWSSERWYLTVITLVSAALACAGVLIDPQLVSAPAGSASSSSIAVLMAGGGIYLGMRTVVEKIGIWLASPETKHKVRARWLALVVFTVVLGIIDFVQSDMGDLAISLCGAFLLESITMLLDLWRDKAEDGEIPGDDSEGDQSAGGMLLAKDSMRPSAIERVALIAFILWAVTRRD